MIHLSVPGNKKSVEENSRFVKCPRENRPISGAGSGLAGRKSKTISERPLIGYGSSRYEQMKWLSSSAAQQKGWNRVNDTSLAIGILQGTF